VKSRGEAADLLICHGERGGNLHQIFLLIDINRALKVTSMK
jgi:hypothetical protein